MANTTTPVRLPIDEAALLRYLQSQELATPRSRVTVRQVRGG